MSTQTEDLTVKTEAMRVFGDKELLTERPLGMDFATYKVLLNAQSRMIKRMFRHKPSKKIARLMETKYGYNLH